MWSLVPSLRRDAPDILPVAFLSCLHTPRDRESLPLWEGLVHIHTGKTEIVQWSCPPQPCLSLGVPSRGPKKALQMCAATGTPQVSPSQDTTSYSTCSPLPASIHSSSPGRGAPQTCFHPHHLIQTYNGKSHLTDIDTESGGNTASRQLPRSACCPFPPKFHASPVPPLALCVQGRGPVEGPSPGPQPERPRL